MSENGIAMSLTMMKNQTIIRRLVQEFLHGRTKAHMLGLAVLTVISLSKFRSRGQSIHVQCMPTVT